MWVKQKVKLMLKLHGKNDREAQMFDTRYARGMTGKLCAAFYCLAVC